eukprot:6492740-Amphidinium_carterae.3
MAGGKKVKAGAPTRPQLFKRAKSSSVLVEPEAKKIPSGCCVCEACGKSSKGDLTITMIACANSLKTTECSFKTWTGPSMPKDVKWALMKRMKSGQEVPQGSSCDSCFTGHSEFFNHMEWAEFCEGMQKPESLLTSQLQTARDIQAGTKQKDWTPQGVVHSDALAICCSKEFVGLTSNEVRKSLGLQKITKAVLDKVPSVTITTEDGLEQELFLFVSPTKPFRTVTISSQATFDHQKHVLQPSEQKWSEQGEHVWLHSSESSREKQNVRALLQSLSLQSLEEFVSKEQQQQQQQQQQGTGTAMSMDPDGEGAEQDVPADSDSECELVGAAASQAKQQQLEKRRTSLSNSVPAKKQKPGDTKKSAAPTSDPGTVDDDDLDRMTALTNARALTAEPEADGGVQKNMFAKMNNVQKNILTLLIHVSLSSWKKFFKKTSE